MPTITIDVPRKKESDVLKFLSGFDYIKIKDRKKIKDNYKKKIVNSLKEVDLMEKGKLEQSSINEFLEELRNEK
jgi:hypothetical protein